MVITFLTYNKAHNRKFKVISEIGSSGNKFKFVLAFLFILFFDVNMYSKTSHSVYVFQDTEFSNR